MRRVIIDILPYVKMTSMNRDANSATNIYLDTEADGQPRKKLKKSGGKGPVAVLKESVHLGCVSQDYSPKNLNLRKVGKLGSNHTVKFSKGTLAPHQNSGKKGSIARNYPKVCTS